MPGSGTSETKATRSRRRSVVVALGVAAAAMIVSACVPEAAAPPPSTVPSTVPSTIKTVSNAMFEWTISREADNGSFAPGEVNYWSAGQSDSTAASYVPTNGNVTVLKKNASGTYVPIGSEAAVTYANRNRDGAGNVVTATNAFYLGQKVRFTGGTGTVNTATGVSTIQWTGTFTVNFYGRYVPFWIINPKLTVNSAGAGQITAAMGGYASSLENPDVRTPLPNTPNVVVANFTSVYSGGSIATGFTRTPTYLGTSVTGVATAQSPQNGTNSSYWGSWPQSFVTFQESTGSGSYWYTSNGAADPKKPQEPVTISYTLNP